MDMCTALTLKTKDFYFGRTLDIERSYHELVTVTPRNFPFRFREEPANKTHYALIGMAAVFDNQPLYYDAVNEKGLAMAGLNFPYNAYYSKNVSDKKRNIAPFEFIPWILSQCSSVSEAEMLLKETQLIDMDFSSTLPNAPLHWIIADKNKALTVEPTKKGLLIYDNPLGLLTNNPPFEFQMFNMNNYMHLSNKNPENNFSKEIDFKIYSLGMGALGLPGDLSSQSRFIKAAFTKMHSVCNDSEEESISQFFHITNAVEHPRGCVKLDNGLYELTVYASCCNTDKGIYYYTTYENRQITAVDMRKENLNAGKLITYPLLAVQQIKRQN